MGLKIHSLEGFPDEHTRDYYVYLLDYGWDEPLGQALRNNFDKFATLSSKLKNSVVVMRTEDGVEFNDDVLSWHGINGDSDPSLLPAVLITNRHPAAFREQTRGSRRGKESQDLKLILIPLKRHCKNTGEVIMLVQSIFKQIAEGKDLNNFSMTEKRKRGEGNALVDSVVIEPTKENVSIKLDEIINFLHSGSLHKGVEKIVLPIHFEDRSGTEFERLTFAYLLDQKKWDTLHWLGQTGGDGGRDVWGELSKVSYCYQCANYQSLTIKKAKEDIDKLAENDTIPDHWTLVCGGRVTAGIRKQTIEYAYKKLKGLKSADVWSGVEFEERVRKDSPLLIKRFVQGEGFPDTFEGLKSITDVINASDDQEIIKLLAECFDRPAFTTAFRNESNIPDFEKAITDTIEVLNTGLHRLRDGTLVRKIPSRHQVNDKDLKSGLAIITQLVIDLRTKFNELKKDKEIKPCGCGQPDCPVWMLSDKACREMDKIRSQIFQKFKLLLPGFNLQLH
jgi:hypothetical protein